MQLSSTRTTPLPRPLGEILIQLQKHSVKTGVVQNRLIQRSSPPSLWSVKETKTPSEALFKLFEGVPFFFIVLFDRNPPGSHQIPWRCSHASTLGHRRHTPASERTTYAQWHLAQALARSARRQWLDPSIRSHHRLLFWRTPVLCIIRRREGFPTRRSMNACIKAVESAFSVKLFAPLSQELGGPAVGMSAQ